MPIVSIIKASTLSDYLGRIDAEFYKPASLNADAKIKFGNYRYLGRLVKDGYRVVYENTKILQPAQVNEERDCRFLQATNISEDGLWIDVRSIGWVSERDWNRYPKGRVELGEILVEVKGSAEKVTIVPNDFPTRTLVTGTLFKLSLKKEFISHEYLFAFLNSKFGKILRDRTKVNTLIAYVSKPELYRIPVFIPNMQAHSLITSLVLKAFEQQKLSKSLYTSAYTLFEKTLELDAYKFKQHKTFSSSFSAVINSKKISSYYFQPKYLELVEKIKGKSVKLKSLLKYYSSGYAFPKKAIVDYNTGFPLLKINNLKPSEIEQDGDVFVTLEHRKKSSSEICEIDDLLIGMSGTIGVASIVKANSKGASINQRIFRAQLKGDCSPEYLSIVVNSFIGKMQLERVGTGGVQTNISPSDILKVLVPRLGKVEQEITTIVNKSFQAKYKSQELLIKAEKLVEELIEQEATIKSKELQEIDT